MKYEMYFLPGWWTYVPGPRVCDICWEAIKIFLKFTREVFFYLPANISWIIAIIFICLSYHHDHRNYRFDKSINVCSNQREKKKSRSISLDENIFANQSGKYSSWFFLNSIKEVNFFCLFLSQEKNIHFGHLSISIDIPKYSIMWKMHFRDDWILPTIALSIESQKIKLISKICEGDVKLNDDKNQTKYLRM